MLLHYHANLSQPIKDKENHIMAIFLPVLTTMYATFEDVRTFPNAFLSVVKVGVR